MIQNRPMMFLGTIMNGQIANKYGKANYFGGIGFKFGFDSIWFSLGFESNLIIGWINCLIEREKNGL